MKASFTKIRIRRITVALDASAQDRQTLKAALRMATDLEAELEGVFVENPDLLKLAELSFSREVRETSLKQHAMDAQRLEREFRVQANRTRQALEEAARPHGVNCSFRVWRGRVSTQFAQMAAETDALILGPIGTFKTIIPRHHARPVMEAENSFGVLFTGSEASERALAIAAKLAAQQKAELQIFLLAAESGNDALHQQANTLVNGISTPVRYVILEQSNIKNLAQEARRAGNQVLFIPRDRILNGDQAVWDCIETSGCPIILIP